MSSTISFKAKARTIDHLGKGQIADTPTAVSELWKNAYDAYARDVALHTFDESTQCGAIIDNGCGMTLEQVIDNWLVIGTNSKTNKQVLPEADRFGLKKRFTQGEKGIGRLSAAFLAPVTLLVTKKMTSKFTVVLIDWRLFENPYLSLDEIRVPITEVDTLEELTLQLPSLILELSENFTRNDSTLLAWEKFSIDEKNSQIDITTQEKITEFSKSFTFPNRILSSWEELLNKVKVLDGESHGSALYLLDLNNDLSLLTNRNQIAVDNAGLEELQTGFIDTLKAFVDPYDRKIDDEQFLYGIKVFDKEFQERNILNGIDTFGYEDFCSFEHRVEGVVDEKGWFRGKITAFGKSLGDVAFPPIIPIYGQTKCGPFSINLATFEYDKSKSSYDEDTHTRFLKNYGKDSGILIFRDKLRVLPYGRSSYDFFSIEERRGTNAGRFFWANRRTYGYIGLDQNNNSNLRDKAGREGFIINPAAREFRELVIAHLIELADKFFGGKSDARKEILNLITKERAERKDAQKKAKKQSQSGFKLELKEKRPILDEKIEKARDIYTKLVNSNISIEKTLYDLSKSLDDLDEVRGELKTPIKPPKVNTKQELPYREYRDLFNEFSELIKSSNDKIANLTANISKLDPQEEVKKQFNKKQGLLNKQVSKYQATIRSKTEKLLSIWDNDAGTDRSIFHEKAINIVDITDSKINLEKNLNLIDSIYTNLADTFTLKYGFIIRALDRLENGINLDAAFSMAEEEKEYFEDKAKKMQSLAQLGISVEVLAHELEQLDMLVTRGLNSLPSDIKNHSGYKTAYDAHKALTHQIRFLSPLKLSGYQMRQDITGQMIRSHVERFFNERFDRQRVDVSFSECFINIVVRDLPSRIYPVFINIINNALYWVSLSDIRKISFDVINNYVVIGNTGPMVDEDDRPKLFELFYSKRANGNGVGLHLCKENLAVAHHKIWYAENDEEKIFVDGANFVIEFNGMESKI